MLQQPHAEGLPNGRSETCRPACLNQAVLAFMPKSTTQNSCVAQRFIPTVLVHAALMQEGVSSHNRSVWLHHHARVTADHAAGGVDVDGVDAGPHTRHLLLPVQDQQKQLIDCSSTGMQHFGTVCL
eukprot:GHUV01033841.1.p1 GENE.GHUV01033841.1~~GHUV01033841.1.p1  ORF type:complete len:126 (-),score=2.16 GHUV01033841.1:193-570(-)